MAAHFDRTTALATVRRRLVRQRLAGEPLEQPPQVVEWLVAAQAQELAEAKWSLGERTRDCTDADVEASFARGEFIRTHVLRPTWHFVAAKDLRWLLRLTRSRIHALNRYWYRKFELDSGVLARGQAIIARSLEHGEALTRAELAERLRAAGIEAKGPRLGYLLMHAELGEVVCSGPRRGKQQTYALFDDRVPDSPRDGMLPEDALCELVLRYFRSHGPATVRDFTAWSSLTVADTRRALARIGGALSCVEDEAGLLWCDGPAEDEAPAGHPTAFLVPMYDETIVAYQDLRVVLAAQPPRSGLLDRAIVIDGLTVGSWKRRLTSRRVMVEATLFRPLADFEARALDDAVARFGRFLALEPSLQAREAR